MKALKKFLLVTSVIALSTFAPLPVVARYAHVETKQVPIARLIKNLEARMASAKEPSSDAYLEFEIGRLYSMAFAEGITAFPALSDDPNEGPYWGHRPMHRQFVATPAKDQAGNKIAQEHLNKAVEHLSQAVKLDPQLTAAKLGLAWCLEQRGEKQKAIGLYREVFRTAWEKESAGRGGLRGGSVANEAGQYLLKLLNKDTDKNEIADITSKSEKLEKIYTMITPIAIPLTAPGTFEQMVSKRDVIFDLEGKGPRRYRPWISNNAGWLVYDANGSRKIRSGKQLFGSNTFWVFWRDGYEALAALDDNQDGTVSGSELVGMAVWQDLNSNGKSEKGEVKSLADCGIIGLSYQYETKPDGVMCSPSGVTFSTGEKRPTYDLLLERQNH